MGAVISRLLVANRGEIARRVMRTCRRAGISTVAVFADPDADSPHVAEADLAVRLPGASSADTYLNAAAIVAAAQAAGADAVHPGYGFLAEDAGFAQRVLDAGLTWVGPPPKAMSAMAIKIEARKRAARAGVPVLAELDPASVTEFPVLVKASAGGGGRGMRAVRAAADLPAAIESAQREALAAFGDGTVFCEPLLIGARHIEVQVLADTHGTIWALTERDCSVQRRYAKVIEETPSPAVGPQLRERLLAAATALAQAVGYVNAGTVEFLVLADEFYFLEFNTRLQVEHPVTECVHGLDLVALQLGIAQGMLLPDQPPPPTGHAIEARLYAEDPVRAFRPSGGPVHAFAIPEVDAEFELPISGQPFLRLDSGVRPGSVVTAHYDAMLAKVIAWAPDRRGAARRLAAALAGARLAGPDTNRDLLVSVLRNATFLDQGADTSLLDHYDYAALTPTKQAVQLCAVAATAAIAATARQDATVAAAVPGGWRNVPSQPQRTSFTGPGDERIDVDYQWTRRGIVIGDALVRSAAPDRVSIESGGVCYSFGLTRADDQLWVDSALGSLRLTLLDRLPRPARAAESGSLLAPMPGSVTKIATPAGAHVSAGQLVLVLEAMKMEHQILAPGDGVLTELRVGQGSQVNAGDVLAIVTGDQTEENS